jgi:antirestriction protein ArdC
LGKRFGDEAYAIEELIAELGSAYTMANLQLESTPRQDHAQYIQSWLRVLKADSRAIFTAASQAQKAADYLIHRAGETSERAA